MKVRIRYFASVREKLGAEEAVELGEGQTVAALRDLLIARDDAHAEALGRQLVLRSARNRSMCAEAEALAEGDEIGFFPPVTGG